MTSSTSAAPSTGGGANEENKHGEQGAEELKAASPFDRLPDEVVGLIVDGAADYGKRELSTFALNRRLYRIAREVYWSELHAASEGNGPRRIIKRLAREHDRQRQIRRLWYFNPKRLESAGDYESAILTGLTNLVELQLTTFGVRVPAHLTETIQGYSKLTKLTLSFYGDATTEDAFEDPSFSLGSHLPLVNTLVFDINTRGVVQLLSQPCPNLKRLDLAVTPQSKSIIPLLPWSSLVTLSIRLPHVRTLGYFQRPLFKISIQLDQRATAIPLRRLALHNMILERTPYYGGADQETLTIDQTLELFKLLAQTSVEHLQLLLPGSLDDIDEVVTIPSVRSVKLRLGGEKQLDVRDAATPHKLYTLLRLFPNLEYLELEYFDFAPDRYHTDPPADSIEFLLKRPTLCALLAYLRQSALLSLTLDNLGDSKHRWTRRTKDEEFRVERYKRVW
ncbi:hypothetical protein JCM8097_007530 [Rhodosporidiobolus ruineniae]